MQPFLNLVIPAIMIGNETWEVSQGLWNLESRPRRCASGARGAATEPAHRGRWQARLSFPNSEHSHEPVCWALGLFELTAALKDLTECAESLGLTFEA